MFVLHRSRTSPTKLETKTEENMESVFSNVMQELLHDVILECDFLSQSCQSAIADLSLDAPSSTFHRLIDQGQGHTPRQAPATSACISNLAVRSAKMCVIGFYSQCAL